MAAAGVSWGTFFEYFPTKADVFLESAAQLNRAFARAVSEGLASGRAVSEVARDAFEAANPAIPADLGVAVFEEVLHRPGRVRAYASGDEASMIDAMESLLAEGQRRREIRDDYPARSLATVTVWSVLISAVHDATEPDDAPRRPSERKDPSEER